MFDYPGVIHVHSRYSDGSACYRGIARAAAKTGVKFVLLNDHDTLGGLHREGEGYINGVMLLIGAEISPPSNHFICYDINTLPSKLLTPASYVENVYEQGGFGFLAHPDHKPNKFQRYSMGWDNWDISQPFGIELWNYFTQWSNQISNFWSLMRGVMTPAWCLQGPCSDLLARWDSIAQKRKVPGIAGVDAHGGRQLGWVPSILSSYVKQFQTLRTHILTTDQLTGNSRDDRTVILDAIRNGRSYLINRTAGETKVFRFGASYKGQHWTIGDEIQWHKGITLNAEFPKKTYARLIHDGNVVHETNYHKLNYLTSEPGVYRLEVFKPWGRYLAPWIFTNHIYLRS